MITEKWLFLIIFKRMADRFSNCDAKKLPQFKENAQNLNTKKSTKTLHTVWTTWAEEKGYSPDIVRYESKELDEKLQRFFAEVRKKDGSDYEPDSLWVMVASLDYHLKEAGSNISIAKDREFVDSRRVLEGKAQPRSQGLSSNRPLGRARRDPGLVWSRATLTIENIREGSSVIRQFVALSFVALRPTLFRIVYIPAFI